MENSNAKRLARNTGLLFIRMLVVLVITLYTSRVLLKVLGFEDMGIYNVVGSVVIFCAFLKKALTSATSRYLNYALGKGDEDEISKVYSMAINCHIILSVGLLFILEIIGVWFINTHLNIPPERLHAANIVFQFSLVSFCLSIVQTPFHSNIIAHERMGIFAFLSVLEAVLKLAVVFAIASIGYDKLISYSLLLCLVSILVFALYVFFCSVYFKDSKYIRFWDTAMVGQFASYSGWSMLVNGADITTQQCISIFFNIFLGTVANAALGIANQISSGIGMFLMSFSESYKPQIIKSYASGSFEYFDRLIFSASKISFILYLLIALPIAANLVFVLGIWLGDYPASTPAFVLSILVYFLFDSFQEPLWQAVHATGKLRTHQIMIASIKFLAIPAMYFVLKAGYSGAAALAVWAGLNVVCAIARTLYMKHLINLDLKAYLSRVILRITVLFLAVVPVTFWISRTLGSNWKGFLVSSAVSVALVLAVGIFFVLDSNERGLLKSVPILGKLIK